MRRFSFLYENRRIRIHVHDRHTPCAEAHDSSKKDASLLTRAPKRKKTRSFSRSHPTFPWIAARSTVADFRPDAHAPSAGSRAYSAGNAGLSTPFHLTLPPGPVRTVRPKAASFRSIMFGQLTAPNKNNSNTGEEKLQYH